MCKLCTFFDFLSFKITELLPFLGYLIPIWPQNTSIWYPCTPTRRSRVEARQRYQGVTSCLPAEGEKRLSRYVFHFYLRAGLAAHIKTCTKRRLIKILTLPSFQLAKSTLKHTKHNKLTIICCKIISFHFVHFLRLTLAWNDPYLCVPD